MVKVKICGNTNLDDVFFAASHGADFVGFIVDVSFSKDSITIKEAKEMTAKLPLEVTPVIVTYLSKARDIVELVEYIDAPVVQLHNPEVTVLVISNIKKSIPSLKVIKTIHVEDESAIDVALEFSKVADYLLLDTKSGAKLGGTGTVHDWEISRKIVKSVKCNVFLAGGLNPANVGSAVLKVQPFGVDTNSGVKLKDRKKDHFKLENFVKRAKESQ